MSVVHEIHHHTVPHKVLGIGGPSPEERAGSCIPIPPRAPQTSVEGISAGLVVLAGPVPPDPPGTVVCHSLGLPTPLIPFCLQVELDSRALLVVSGLCSLDLLGVLTLGPSHESSVQGFLPPP